MKEIAWKARVKTKKQIVLFRKKGIIVTNNFIVEIAQVAKATAEVALSSARALKKQKKERILVILEDQKVSPMPNLIKKHHLPKT